jgi:hypothetical protein
MGLHLPPVSNTGQFEAQLSQVPARLREDALQEAWVAHLDGRDPLQVMWKYVQRERRREKHGHIEFNEEGEPFVIDRDGSRCSLPAFHQSKSSVGTRRRNSLAKAG